MESSAQAISISGGEDLGNELLFPNPRNPFVQVGISSPDLGEIPHALPLPNPFDQGDWSSDLGEITHDLPFPNTFDQAGVSSIDMGEIPPALQFFNPFGQVRASSLDLGEIPHALPFSNPFDQAGEALSTGSLSLKSWEIALDSGMDQLEESCHFIPLCKLLKATNDFDDALVIGTGGFGKVYKATIDEGSTTTVAAIKRLNAKSNQGAEEFWTEVKLLSKFQHKHLVSLIGYCNEHQEMILVYEYIARGTLANHLYIKSIEDSGGSRSRLTWEQRLNICLDAARGLSYLHNGTGQGIIHRDVKSTNILLDENWIAKLSDFGISKHIPSYTTTHVTTNVKGTFGYYDPEYFLTKKLRKKSDVYAFGVVLLEVLCGRPPIDTRLEEEQISLIFWAQKYIKKGKIDRIMDPSLHGETTPHSLKYFAELAYKCLRTHPKERPTMAEVMESLDIALVSHKRRQGISWGTITKAFQGIKLVPGLNRWWREGNSNSSNDGGRLPKQSLRILNKAALSVYRRFSFAEIRAATNNFNEGLLISRLCFCDLYKGYVAGGNTPAIAITRFKLRPPFGEYGVEIQVQRLTSHPNILSLLGFCNEKHEYILVYNCMANGTLGSHLHETDKDTLFLLWKKRLEICIDTARGLEYLHTNAKQQFIHCDVNPSNILLDDKWVAKVSGFELSLPIPTGMATEGMETDCIRGTRGYLAPEFLRRKISKKVDVFSFGVVLLEVVCAKPTNYEYRDGDCECLVDSFLFCIEKGTTDDVIDPYLLGKIAPECFRRYVNITLSCLVVEGIRRPSMDDVLGGLQSALYMQKTWEKSIEMGGELHMADVPQSYNDIISAKNEFTIGGQSYLISDLVRQWRTFRSG